MSSRPGVSLGLGKGIHESGPIFSLLFGSLCLEILGAQSTFFLMAIISLPSIFFSWKIQDQIRLKETSIKVRFRFGKLKTVNLLSFISAFTVDGVLVVSLAYLLSNSSETVLFLPIYGISVSIWLGVKRIFSILFSPIAGRFTERFGFERVFQFSLFFTCIGVLILPLYSLLIGLIVVFIFNGVHAAIGPGRAAMEEEDRSFAASRNSFWSDIGTALGTLFGSLFLYSEIVTFWVPIILSLSIILILILQKIKNRRIVYGDNVKFIQ
nr:MFS transporter [Leptospira ainazelensis]